MDEFVSRMATQRHVLNVVNSKVVLNEQLFGLSAKAIERWATSNNAESLSDIVCLLKQISCELFFMATRSQEPVSVEYTMRERSILEAVSALEDYLN